MLELIKLAKMQGDGGRFFMAHSVILSHLVIFRTTTF